MFGQEWYISVGFAVKALANQHRVSFLMFFVSKNTCHLCKVITSPCRLTFLQVHRTTWAQGFISWVRKTFQDTVLYLVQYSDAQKISQKVVGVKCIANGLMVSTSEQFNCMLRICCLSEHGLLFQHQKFGCKFLNF